MPDFNSGWEPVESILLNEASKKEILLLSDEGFSPLEISRRTRVNLITVNNLLAPKSDGKVIQMPRKKGNPTSIRYTEEQKQEALNLVNEGYYQRDAAEKLGIHYATISKWVVAHRKKDKSKTKPAKKSSDKQVSIDPRDELIAVLKAENETKRKIIEMLLERGE